jgi:hypothetical protein
MWLKNYMRAQPKATRRFFSIEKETTGSKGLKMGRPQMVSPLQKWENHSCFRLWEAVFLVLSET